MKKLSAYLFLILFSFSAPSFADDIRDFQIEGMSIGDSLLDYFSEEEIKEGIRDYYKDRKEKKFASADFFESTLFNTYDGAQISFKTNDQKYLIYGMSGMIEFSNNINECYKKRDEIVKELSKIFKNIKKETETKDDYEGVYTVTYFSFESGDFIQVACYDWVKESNNIDHLRIGMITNEFNEWLIE